ncbi:MAG: HU family DNA-binding protein [Parabacteroides gordonii]|nr:HU family DNA-binding protein [Parabacteroides gordonii]
MNKSELESIIARKLDKPVGETRLFVNTMLESIAEVLAANEEINLRNFGKLYPNRRKERLVRNPKNGVPCMLKPTLSVKFNPGKGLIDYINIK